MGLLSTNDDRSLDLCPLSVPNTLRGQFLYSPLLIQLGFRLSKRGVDTVQYDTADLLIWPLKLLQTIVNLQPTSIQINVFGFPEYGQSKLNNFSSKLFYP